MWMNLDPYLVKLSWAQCWTHSLSLHELEPAEYYTTTHPPTMPHQLFLAVGGRREVCLYSYHMALPTRVGIYTVHSSEEVGIKRNALYFNNLELYSCKAKVAIVYHCFDPSSIV
jgi:hypothetical protein